MSGNIFSQKHKQNNIFIKLTLPESQYINFYFLSDVQLTYVILFNTHLRSTHLRPGPEDAETTIRFQRDWHGIGLRLA